MPGHRRRQRTAFGKPHTPCGHACHQHHWLCVGGERQRFLGAFVDQARHVFAQGIGRLAQRLGHHGVVTPAIEHANGLRALAGKYECKDFGHLESDGSCCMDHREAHLIRGFAAVACATSELEQNGTPGKATAHAFQQQRLAGLDLA
ncbi:hypothetical protein SDC9_137567 [bioreactor metagenome]|uniref:Uncharacterized protein n=1 Tax=bioreactor metagenome TaxID=1076179 RepID=A0A645DM93_9ZZZZ